MITEEEVYDLLSQTHKHIMLRNGILESQFDNIGQGICCCLHPKSDHLWPTLDCCLVKELCICDRFLDRNFKTPVAERYGKPPSQQKEETAEVIVKEG